MTETADLPFEHWRSAQAALAQKERELFSASLGGAPLSELAILAAEIGALRRQVSRD